MRAVLLDGIVEVFLATISEALCPFQLVFAAEYPAAVVFALDDKDALFVQHQQVDFCGLALHRQVKVSENHALSFNAIAL